MVINNGVRDHPQDALADDHDAVAARHRAISDLLDPFTQWRIAALEPDLTGARVLAIGPGYGNLAWWLGEQVGATGQVVAFSRDVSHLPHHPQVSLVGHDLTTGTVPVSGPFDLIHARLTLAYTSHRRQLLHQLANRLGPGGWLLVEDWAISERDRDVVVRAASLVEQDLYERFHRALTRVFAVSGTDSRWGAHLHTHFLE
ncbi:MAG TPA: methyltransferase domain-containing protein, partial [Natronosporangium sp.]|nr:methyltransferase domain-containing protein [Natronosporangium sp.]